MKIVDKLSAGPAFSFEFFPPKDQEGVGRLFETIHKLAPFQPAYVSVTYGAGGSTRRLTVELVRRIKQEVGIEAMAHLTCVGAGRDEIASVLGELEQGGIDNVIALRGDPPKGVERFERHADGFAYASELISFIRKRWNFCIAGACYPQKHPDAADDAADLRALKLKVDAGARFLITQLFFLNDDYFRFVDRARGAGIQVPIIPGIWPITNLAQIKRITGMCGASIPGELLQKLEAAGEPARVQAVGVAHATAQCRELIARGAPGIHFYTLNRSPATREILEQLRT